MHILFITDNFPPEVNAPATRTYEHCMEWIKAGHQVTVITCAPNFPRGKVFDGYKNKIYQTAQFDGVKVIRVWSYIAANQGFIKRIIDFVSFAITSFFAGLFVRKVDVIIGTSPQFFTTVSAYGLSVFKRKPWVFELRDLWPESIRAVTKMTKSRSLDKFEQLELFLYKKANMIVSVTDSFKKNLIKRGIDGNKIAVVKNGANLNLYQPLAKNTVVRKDLKIDDKFVIGYIGTHGMAHKLDIFLNLAGEKSFDEKYHFLFIGTGAEKKKMIEIAREKQLNNVTFLAPIEKKQIPSYLSAIDAALVPLKKSDTFKTVIPSKIFESSSMRIPVLLGVEGESKEIVEKYKAGLTFEPENLEDFVKKIELLSSDEAVYKACQEGGSKLAKDFDRAKLADKMITYVETLL